MNKRIYEVSSVKLSADPAYLVRASNASQAIRFIAQREWNVEVATQDRLVKLLGDGVKVQEAGSDE